jgi:phage protein D
MLRCSALVRAALKASKQDVTQVTRTLNQLSLLPQSASLGSSSVRTTLDSSSVRAFATRTAARSRKPAARKTGTATKKRTTKKKAAAKKKPAARKKAKKAAPKKPKKRVPSEKAKAALEKKKALVTLRELKAKALVEPKGKPDTAWTVFLTEKLQGKGGAVTEGIKVASAEYKSLSSEDREVGWT